jgi:hypothetical protein
MPLPDPIIEVLTIFRPCFPAPTWRKLMLLLTGTLLARGRRTVTAALRHTGSERVANWSRFHQVLNRGRWSPLAVSRQLLLLIVETFVAAEASVDLVIDETLERRWGEKIRKRGHYRDSARSSRERSVSSPGLRWIVMAVVVNVPWSKQRWALPFLCVRATTPDVSERLGKRHKTIGRRAEQMVALVRRWLPTRSIKLMGATAYSVLELGLQANAQQVTLVMTGRLDAVLHAPPPERTRAVHRASPGGWQALAFVGAGAAGSGNGLAAAHPGVVWRGGANAGVLHRHCVVVSHRIGAVVDPLGRDPRSSRQAPSQSHLFHRSHRRGRRDDQRLHETLESGSHL